MTGAIGGDRMTADARLLMLRELTQQIGARCNDAVLQYVLDVHGISRSRDWVRTQLRWLEEMGAVQLATAGSTLIATLRAFGRDHVERRALIDGVSPPPDEI